MIGLDRIKTDAMVSALERFGIPPAMVDMVQGIYKQREVIVRDMGTISSQRRQAAGIAQGCPLSPYLFIIVMSVLLEDVASELDNVMGLARSKPYIVTQDLLYADDTKLVATSPESLEHH